MREIKFRAWDSTNMTKTFCVTSQGRVRKHLIGVDFEDLDHYILMQFTGLLDKNGKEIYEGDIVKLSEPKDKWSQICKVEWKDFAFQIDNAPLSGILNYTKYEVVGNIYENPELKEIK